MSDTRGLLDRISAFRQRLENTPQLAAGGPDPAVPAAVVADPEAFDRSLRQITAAPVVNEGPLPPQLTARTHRLLQQGRELLDRQRAFSADPVFAGLSAATGAEPAADPLVGFHRGTVAVMDAALRLVQAFPDSPTLQLKLSDGLDGMLGIVRERLGVQERALKQRRADLHRVDRLAAIYTALHEGRAVTLKPVAALAEELLEDARQGKPLRFLEVPVDSAHAYPGGLAFPAPARFAAAHALSAAQVVCRMVPFDFEWAGRPLLAVVAALLMDCGMMTVPPAVLAKTEPWTEDDRRAVEAHPQKGAEMLARHMKEAAPLVEAVATHHERVDGTGYPVGLKGDSLPALGRMLAVADVYAALGCPRPHRPAHDTRSALAEVLLMAEHRQLDKDFAEFLAQLSFYPVGTVVELTDGRIGLVTANHPNRVDPRAPNRPVVAVLAEADGTLLARPDYLDLSAADRGGILGTLTADRRRALLGSRYPELV